MLVKTEGENKRERNRREEVRGERGKWKREEVRGERGEGGDGNY